MEDDKQDKKKLLIRAPTTLQERFDAGQALDKYDIQVKLNAARDWMLESMDESHMRNSVWMRVEKWFGVSCYAITKENFKILEDAIENTEDEDAKELFMVEDLTVGPALPYVYKANFITWGFFLLMTYLAYHLVDIDDNGLALPPKRSFLVLCILLWIGVAAITLVYEACAGLYVLPTQLIYVDKLGLFKKRESFKTWSFVMLLISFILHSDVYTTAIFIGRVARSTFVCDELEMHWRRSVNHGFLRHIPFMGSATFFHLSMTAWFIMFLQFGYALAYSYPLSPDIGQNSPILTTFAERRASPKYDMVKTVAQSAVYKTFLRNEAGHGRASAALAESGRMMSINWHDDDYLQNAELQWGCVRVHQEMRRANIRFVFFALQSILIPNLQITFLGVQKTVGGSDWLTTSSVVLTVSCGVKYIVYELQSCRKHWKFAMAAIERHKKNAIDNKSNAEYYKAVMVEYMVSFSYNFNFFFCIFSIGMFGQLLMKAVMAMTICSSGVWDIALWPPDGCQDFGNVTVMDPSCPNDTAVYRHMTFMESFMSWGQFGNATSPDFT